MKDTGQLMSNYPTLPVKNVKETAAFYRDKLGFKVEVIWDGYACVRRDHVFLEFAEGHPTPETGPAAHYLHAIDVDRLFSEFQQAGVELLNEVGDREHGTRDFSIKDNNGNVLIFANPLPWSEPTAHRRVA